MSTARSDGAGRACGLEPHHHNQGPSTGSLDQSARVSSAIATLTKQSVERPLHAGVVVADPAFRTSSCHAVRANLFVADQRHAQHVVSGRSSMGDGCKVKDAPTLDKVVRASLSASDAPKRAKERCKPLSFLGETRAEIFWDDEFALVSIHRGQLRGC